MTKIKRFHAKTVLLLLLSIFITLISLSNALAIGVTPGRTTLDFQPNLQRTIEIAVLNNEHKDMKIAFGVMGELADYVSLNAKSLELKPDEESKSIAYTINLPSSLQPGTQEAKIIVTEVPKDIGENDVTVGAAIVTISQLLVKVPYPYKYAEIRLKTKDASNGKVNIYVEVDNLGQHDLVDRQAIIEIFGPTNEKIAVLKTDTKTIPAGKKDELVASWQDNVNAGQYKAVASLAYDEGKIANAEGIFSVGSLGVDVVDISVKNFRLGEIAKFEIVAENKWNQATKDVFAQLQIFDGQSQNVADVKTASLDISPLSRQILTAYWDTAGIKEGEYSGKIILNFAGQKIERQLKTEIKLNSIKVEIVGGGLTAKVAAVEGGKQNLMLILIVVLIVINIAWFVYFKYRTKK